MWLQSAVIVAESEHALGGSSDPVKRGDLVRNSLVVADYGPRFVGLVARTHDSLACVAPPSYKHQPTVRAVMRELVTREGGNCALCLNCPIGRMMN